MLVTQVKVMLSPSIGSLMLDVNVGLAGLSEDEFKSYSKCNIKKSLFHLKVTVLNNSLKWLTLQL